MESFKRTLISYGEKEKSLIGYKQKVGCCLLCQPIHLTFNHFCYWLFLLLSFKQNRQSSKQRQNQLRKEGSRPKLQEGGLVAMIRVNRIPTSLYVPLSEYKDDMRQNGLFIRVLLTCFIYSQSVFSFEASFVPYL
jgi:hypothetical protein